MLVFNKIIVTNSSRRLNFAVLSALTSLTGCRYPVRGSSMTQSGYPIRSPVLTNRSERERVSERSKIICIYYALALIDFPGFIVRAHHDHIANSLLFCDSPCGRFSSVVVNRCCSPVAVSEAFLVFILLCPKSELVNPTLYVLQNGTGTTHSLAVFFLYSPGNQCSSPRPSRCLTVRSPSFSPLLAFSVRLLQLQYISYRISARA